MVIVTVILAILGAVATPTIIVPHVYACLRRRPFPGWSAVIIGIQRRSIKSRILLGFVQVLTRLGMSFNMRMPAEVS